jgi:DnaK suppressor protein
MAGPATRTQSEIRRLESEREEVVQKLANLQVEMRTMAEPTADEADVDAYEREKTWALIQSLQRKLESIDLAIQSAKAGKYGICQNCGAQIDPARLDILPQATLCLKCQREFERRNRRTRP